MKNKFLAAMLSLVVAFALWLYVITVVSPGSEETYDGVPVVFWGESTLAERGLMITAYEDNTVSLVLSGNRSDLSKVNRGNITVTADVSKIDKAGKVSVTYDVSFPGDIADNAITKQRQEPDALTLVVEERVSKQVPVVIDYTGKLPEDFICDKENAELDYTAISVQGPKSVINQITQAVIQVSLEDQKQTISEQFIYTLCNDAGEPVDSELVVTNAEAVRLTLKIQRVKEITLSVNIIDGGGATAQTSSISLSNSTIRISGSESLLDKLDNLELGTINLGELTTNTKLTFPISLPEGVTNVTGVTEVTVEVKFPNLQMKRLSVTNIQTVNVPTGLEVDLITEVLEVTVRGPRALVAAMKETDVTVTVDCTNAQIGTATMKATVTISSNYADVGTVGTYVVSATLREEGSEGE